jgi:iron-sulfur cluster repair protein YtfE (RIC family)
MLSNMSRCADYFRNFQNGRCCHGNGQNAKKIEKHKNDHSRLLAKQKLMKLVRNNIHIYWNEINQKKSELVGQILSQSPWKQKKGGFKKILDSFHQTL